MVRADTGRNAKSQPPRRILYGRRKGRPLRAGRRALMNELLPRLAIALPKAPPEEGTILDPATLFAAPLLRDGDRGRGGGGGARCEVWLEIGFGSGEHLAAQAASHPDIGMIGCESFEEGIASLLAKIQDRTDDNIRIFPDDARELLDAFTDASLGRVFSLFPDPWPKKRHWKRRLISPTILDVLARVMADGAELRLATDDDDYAAWMLEHATAHRAFEWMAKGPADWRQRPADWPRTRYEAKAVAQGRGCMFLRFRRRQR